MSFNLCCPERLDTAGHLVSDEPTGWRSDAAVPGAAASAAPFRRILHTETPCPERTGLCYAAPYEAQPEGESKRGGAPGRGEDRPALTGHALTGHVGYVRERGSTFLPVTIMHRVPAAASAGCTRHAPPHEDMPPMSTTAAPIRPLVAGNWKMHGSKAALQEALAVKDRITAEPPAADVMICPPATLLMVLAELARDSALLLGGQDCHTAAAGAHTGDLSPEMLADAGASAVIVGHSERRADHGEMDRDVKAKAAAAHRAGLTAIVCIGETAGQRAAGLTLDIVRRQLDQSLPDGATAANTIVAYEPVWAIGTGLTPTTADVAEVHGAIRASLTARFGGEGAGMRILYGGSVKPDNARELMAVANVDGALVGGASLKADDFLRIVQSYSV